MVALSPSRFALVEKDYKPHWTNDYAKHEQADDPVAHKIAHLALLSALYG